MTVAATPPDSAAPAGTLLDVVQGFVHELRTAGLPVSMTENLDAMRAIEHVSMGDRETFRAALGATLVKHHHHRKAFDTVFDVYFSLLGPTDDEGGELDLARWEEMAAAAREGAGAAGELSPRRWPRHCSPRSWRWTATSCVASPGWP
ncbi:MAG: hypothetical protein M5U14_11740 [Acidimicrobiia bacterium]|nr:hypothetical protein [Acidimicrobiia bacterium]